MIACLALGAALFGACALLHAALRAGWPSLAPRAAFAVCFGAAPAVVLALSVLLDDGASGRVLASPAYALAAGAAQFALAWALRRRLLRAASPVATESPWRPGALRDLVLAPLAVVALDAALASPGDGHYQDELLAALLAGVAAASVRHLADDRPFTNHLVATIPFAAVLARYLSTTDFPVWDSQLFLYPVFRRVGTELAQGRPFSPWHLDPGGVRLGVLHINFLAATPHRIPGYLLLAFTPIGPAAAYKVTLAFGAWLVGLGWSLVLRAVVVHRVAVYVGTLMVMLGGAGITFHQEQSLATIELLPWFTLALLRARTQRGWLVVAAALLGLGTSQHYPQMQAIMLGSTALAGAVLVATRCAGHLAPGRVSPALLAVAVASFALGTLPAIYIFTRLPGLASEMRVGSNFAPDSYDLYARLYGPDMSSAPAWHFGQYVNPVFLVMRGFVDRCGFFVGRLGLAAALGALFGLAVALARRLAAAPRRGRAARPAAHPPAVALTAVLAAFALLAAGLTLGSHGPVPRALFALRFPYINAFRQWAQFFPWINLALSGLAAVAVASAAARVASLPPADRRRAALVGVALLGVQTADLALNARRYLDRMCPTLAPRAPLATFLARVPLGATRVFELRPAFELHHSRDADALWDGPFVASRRVHVDGGWRAELTAGLALQRAGETRAVAVAGPGDDEAAGAAPPRHGTLVPSLEGGGVDVRVPDLERAALVVIPAAFDEGLVATVDGAASALLRVDGALCGVLVPRGTHRVSLRLHGDVYPYLGGLSWLTQLGVALAFLLGPTRSPEAAPTPTPRAPAATRRRGRVSGLRGSRSARTSASGTSETR